jgi:thiol-disulfide isomerase/thioredoxin
MLWFRRLMLTASRIFNVGKNTPRDSNKQNVKESFVLQRLRDANGIFMIGKKSHQVIFFVFLSIWLASPGFSNTLDSLMGQEAPPLSGKKAIGSGLIKLTNLMTEIEFERDGLGKLKEVDDKYVMQVKRNVVVLNFFSTTCIPCIREIPTYNELAETYIKKPVKFIYVNVDTEVSDQKIARFIARRRIKVQMMMPNQKDAIKKYRVYSLPRIVIIDRHRKIAHEIMGFKKDLVAQLTELIDDLL